MHELGEFHQESDLDRYPPLMGMNDRQCSLFLWPVQWSVECRSVASGQQSTIAQPEDSKGKVFERGAPQASEY